MTTITQPLKWHGGKFYLTQRIIALMPRHRTYVEPFAGGLAVLLKKPVDWQALETTGSEHGVAEIVNDLNGGLMQFWQTLGDPELPERFHRRLQMTLHSEAEWEASLEPSDDPLEAAARFMVQYRQSRGGGGADYQTPSKRPRSGMNEHASSWIGAVDGLPELCARLRRVQFLNRPALDVIRQLDSPTTLFNCDPPYHPSTRTSPAAYALEMTDAGHRELLSVLLTVKGKVMLSGYRCKLYDHMLAGWYLNEISIANNAAGGKMKRVMTECVWCNFTPQETIEA